MMVHNLSGQKFGRLVAVRVCGRRSNQLLWLCVCDCGQTKEIVGYSLRSGTSRSCGCLQKERASSAKTTHGKRRSRIYNIWRGMVDRCQNPKCLAYRDYGGRGITLDFVSFEEFYREMGDPPTGMSIDRIDNERGYAPGNCRWATMRVQTRNKRNNVVLSLDGKSMCLADWAERLGVDRSLLRRRIKSGWSDHRVLTAPIRVSAETGGFAWVPIAEFMRKS